MQLSGGSYDNRQIRSKKIVFVHWKNDVSDRNRHSEECIRNKETFPVDENTNVQISAFTASEADLMASRIIGPQLKMMYFLNTINMFNQISANFIWSLILRISPVILYFTKSSP